MTAQKRRPRPARAIPQPVAAITVLGAADEQGERRRVTVMKADISGSTPLAERLDPEELRAVLGSYFAALAREIQRQQGFIDKYIGDAVIAIFGVPEPRADDAERAVRAGIAMQEAIQRENEALERHYGIRLACRIGINTGEVAAGPVAADVQAIFTVVGETVNIAERMEASAALNTVFVSGSTRDATRGAFRFDTARPVTIKGHGEPVAGYQVLGPRRRSSTSGAGTGPATAAWTATGGSASLQVGGVKAHVLQEERKIVTVLFADLSSSEPLSSKLEPSELRNVLGIYFGALAREIQRYGGTIDKYIGDAVMAVFGAPISHEDDGVRAIAAALGIQSSLRGLNQMLETTYKLRISVRIGVNTGEVVAGLLPGEVLAYTVTGDAVNTAQRIESVAPPDAVLVSESTHALARNAFIYEAVPPLTLKGKSEPEPAYRVLGRERRASPRGGATIVGRERELARLWDLYREAVEGRGQLVHVHGEAGVGKTRLVSELLAGLPRDAVRIRTRATSYEQGMPYALVADVIRRMFGVQGSDAEPAARAALVAGVEPLEPASRAAAVTLLLEILGYDARSALDPEGKRRLLVSLLRTFLRHRAEQRPQVVLVEDLHWSDPTSAGVLVELTAVVPEIRCFFMSTSRDAASVTWTAEALALDALDAAAAAEMIDRLAATPVDDATRALILERTAGNPFFIEEVVRSMADGRAGAIPATVQDLLEARLDALDASPRRVAQGAAVVGRTFWKRVLARVTPDEALDPALATLQQQRFVNEVAVTPEATYTFPHALVQEVVYKTQLIAQRRRTHVAVGDAYSDLFSDHLDEFVDALAFHYRRGDDDPKARTWLLRAGYRAQRLYANAEALDYLRDAVKRSADDAAARAEALEAIGDVQTTTGKFDDAIASFRTAEARAAADSATIARLRRKVGMALRVKGAYREASDELASGLAVLGDAPGVEAARIRLEIGQLHWRSGDYAAARSALTEGIEIASALGADDVVAEGLMQLGNTAGHAGDPSEAVDHYQRCWAIYERLDDLVGMASARTNLGTAYARLGRWDEAIEQFDAAVALHERTGNPLYIAITYNNIGETRRLRSDLAQAIEAFERALSIARDIGYAAGVALALTGLGAARVEAGDVERGREDLREAERRFTALGRTTYFADLYRFLAEAELKRADLDAAAKAAARSLEFARSGSARHQEALAQRVLAEIALAQGDADGARSLLESSWSTLAELGEAGELRRTEAILRRFS